MEYYFEKMDMQHQKVVMEIFNYYVEHSTAAFPEHKLPHSFFASILERTKDYSAWVVKSEEENQVVGFCMLTAYLPMSTFRYTAMMSYFIKEEHSRKGLGSKCLEQLQRDAIQIGIRHLFVQISDENMRSIQFHEKHGFYEVGRLPNVAYKFDRTFSIVHMQKDLL